MGATWWPKPTGDGPILVLDVPTRAEWADNCDCFAIEMSKQIAESLLAQAERVARFAADDPSLCSMQFYDMSGEYRDRNHDLEGPTQFDDEGNPPPDWTGEACRTECEVIIITRSGHIFWSADRKNIGDGALIETEPITVDELRNYVRGIDPWPCATIEVQS